MSRAARGAGARVVWRDVRLIAVGVGRPGDVEMHPRDVADELLEEQASGDGARAAAAAVADVGHGGLDLLAIDLPERQLPAAVARLLAGREQAIGQLLVVAH